MTKPNPNLSPCPVCGHLPQIHPVRHAYDDCGRILYWMVQCFAGRRHCVQVQGKTKRRAADVWNSCFPVLLLAEPDPDDLSGELPEQTAPNAMSCRGCSTDLPPGHCGACPKCGSRATEKKYH